MRKVFFLFTPGLHTHTTHPYFTPHHPQCEAPHVYLKHPTQRNQEAYDPGRNDPLETQRNQEAYDPGRNDPLETQRNQEAYDPGRNDPLEGRT